MRCDDELGLRKRLEEIRQDGALELRVKVSLGLIYCDDELIT